MIVSAQKKFVFVRTPKTAGTSIEAALNKFANTTTDGRLTWHATAAEAKSVLQDWDRYFRFAFVRHPYDVQVSMYRYVLRLGSAHPEYQQIRKYRTVSEYVTGHVRTRVAAGRMRKQADFIYSRDGESLINFVGRFERLEFDFNEICGLLRLGRIALPELNRSGPISDPRFTLDGAARCLITTLYQQDFELFEYSP